MSSRVAPNSEFDLMKNFLNSKYSIHKIKMDLTRLISIESQPKKVVVVVVIVFVFGLVVVGCVVVVVIIIVGHRNPTLKLSHNPFNNRLHIVAVVVIVAKLSSSWQVQCQSNGELRLNEKPGFPIRSGFPAMLGF